MRKLEKEDTALNVGYVGKEVTLEMVAEHGLTVEEYRALLKILDRKPNLVELGIFSVMWSEHCSYKSTKKHLQTLPTEAPWVICGPGENAGVIDIGDNQAIVFKMESHNHPSYIEPYQGAATGVGGIMRDVFTMGARPIANMNVLRFGEWDHPKTRHLVTGVVSGIGGYGNCMGIPTVGGECTFHPSYNGNILVNAMCVGLTTHDKIFYSAASQVGSPIVYIGSKTGRDGIHGATMASAEFNDDAEEKRPTVQVGDPFSEKLLLEACQELMETDAILAIQDMGAAGLTSSSLEMAGKGGTGIELELSHVPTREEGMNPYEIMLSESQERMLMVLRPEKEAEAKAIFDKWELDFAVIGKITDTGLLSLKMYGEEVASMPIAPLSEQAPVYDRPHEPTPAKEPVLAKDIEFTAGTEAKALQTLMGSPDICCKRWVWEQYDSKVMNDTVQGPGGDAAVVRVHGTNKAVAISTDCTPRYCVADPVTGGKQAVAESYRNLCAVGARPLAITNCLNFGNPEKPEIMGQLTGCIEGMKEACTTLDFPVVSGNVSLYNETNSEAIYPTPSIGGVGLIDNARSAIGSAFVNKDHVIYLVGDLESASLGSSLFMQYVIGEEKGAPPEVDLQLERRHGEFIRKVIDGGTLSACHDVSDGGIYVAVAEMALSGNLGASIEVPETADVPLFAALFGESQARYIATVEAAKQEQFESDAQSSGVTFLKLGTTGGADLVVNGQKHVSLLELCVVHEGALPAFIADEPLPVLDLPTDPTPSGDQPEASDASADSGDGGDDASALIDSLFD